MLDLVTNIITAGTLGQGISPPGRASAKAKKYSTEEIKRIIFKQQRKLGEVITADPDAFNKNVEEFLDNASKAKRVKTDSEYDNYFNEAQEIKIYLSYYLNRLKRSNNRQLSTLSTTHYREEPYNALIDGLNQNKEDFEKVRRIKNKTGGKRKKTRRNKRKNKTKIKRKAKRKTKNKRKRKHRKTKKR